MTDKVIYPKHSVFEVWRQTKDAGNSTPYWLREPTEQEKRTHDRLDDLQRDGHAKLDPPKPGRNRSWHT